MRAHFSRSVKVCEGFAHLITATCVSTVHIELERERERKEKEKEKTLRAHTHTHTRYAVTYARTRKIVPCQTPLRTTRGLPVWISQRLGICTIRHACVYGQRYDQIPRMRRPNTNHVSADVYEFANARACKHAHNHTPLSQACEQCRIARVPKRHAPVGMCAHASCCMHGGKEEKRPRLRLLPSAAPGPPRFLITRFVSLET